MARSRNLDDTIDPDAIEIAQQKIHPIVEFFPVEYGDREKDFIDTASSDRKLLRKSLSGSKGIYSFYNSEMEVIYIGKTKNNLWNEMKNAFNREMDHYSRFSVNHPHSKYAEPSSGKVRTIRRKKFYIYDAAKYFSAYAINDNMLIDIFELLIIRMMPNDLLNVRIEGNTSLKAFSLGQE